MSDENETSTLSENEGSLAGDALLHAVRRDMLRLFKALDHKVEALDVRVGALDSRVEALDAKVEARLRDTTPMWEVVVSRLDTMIAEQESQGGRLDAIEGRLDAIEGEQRKQGARLDAIEGEIKHLRGRTERMLGELSRDVVEVRAAQHDLEDRFEKLEKTPA